MTKYRNKPCVICGVKDTSKRKVCLSCKEKYPFKESGEGGRPFDRRGLYEKDNKKI